MTITGKIVREITKDELNTYEILRPITTIKKMQIIFHQNVLYGLVNDKLKYIPNEATLSYIRNAGNFSEFIAVNDLRGYKKEEPFISVPVNIVVKNDNAMDLTGK